MLSSFRANTDPLDAINCNRIEKGEREGEKHVTMMIRSV